MPITRKAFVAGAFALGAALVAGVANTIAPSAAPLDKPAINILSGNRVAIHGYDPVAYFVDGGPRKGRVDLSVEHAGAVWRFANDLNRRRFEDNPARFTPAFGGYCAYGVAQGYLVKIDPNAWTIIDDRLYLNYDTSVRGTWLKDPTGYVRTADAKWRGLVSGSGSTVSTALPRPETTGGM